MSIGPFSFNGFDVVVLVILLISLIIAIQRGFLREVLSLVALLLAGVLTLFVWGRFRYDVQDFINPTWLADVTLGVGTFILVYILSVFILSKLFGKMEAPPAKFLNRAMGAVFGIARGLILAALGVMVLTASHRSSLEAQDFKNDILQNPGIYPSDIMDRMPESMREQMDAPPKPLPDYLETSTFYPILDSIGDMIRNLPYADFKSYADRIKDGDIDSIRREITQ